MLGLTDGIGNITSYLYNNLIIDKDQQIVKGVILGDCIYNADGNMVGKIVNDILYNTRGEIVAQKIISGQKSIAKNIADLSRQAWTIISRLKIRIAPWIELSAKWSQATLPEILVK